MFWEYFNSFFSENLTPFQCKIVYYLFVHLIVIFYNIGFFIVHVHKGAIFSHRYYTLILYEFNYSA